MLLETVYLMDLAVTEDGEVSRDFNVTIVVTIILSSQSPGKCGWNPILLLRRAGPDL